MSSPAVEIAGLQVVRGGRPVLDGLSLTVASGSITGLLGPSGCGKTTLMRCVVGVQVTAGGTVTVLGLPAGSPPLRRRVGYVTQAPSVYADLTVRENLTVFARGSGNNAWTLQRIFDLFPNLRARERNLGFQLSGGEQQMLSIARALMLNPSLLVLDEPSEGLAPMIVEEIIGVLRGLKREGLAILLVEQNLRAAFAVGDRHHIMNKGEICFTGTSAEIESNESVLRNYLSV